MAGLPPDPRLPGPPPRLPDPPHAHSSTSLAVHLAMRRHRVGHVLLHHFPKALPGVRPAPPIPHDQPLLTWHPAHGELPDQRHQDTLTCWCRPLVIPVYAEVEDDLGYG